MTAAGIAGSAGRRSSRIVARRWASLTDVKCGNNKCTSMISRYPVVRKRTPWYWMASSEQIASNLSRIFVNSKFALLLLLLTGTRCRRPTESTESSSAPALLCDALLGTRVGVQPVIQIKHHGGTFRRGNDQVFKFPHRVRANRVALVGGEHPSISTLACKNIEMVEPERGHLFLKLALPINGAVNFRHAEFDHDALGSFELLVKFERAAIGISAVVALLGYFCFAAGVHSAVFHRTIR